MGIYSNAGAQIGCKPGFGQPIASFSYDEKRIGLSCEQMSSTDAAKTEDQVCRFSAKSRYAPDLNVELDMRVYKDFEAADWLLYFRNEGTENTKSISAIQALDWEIPLDEKELISWISIAGDSCSSESYMPLNRELKPGVSFQVTPQGGRSSNFSFPFFDLCGKDEGIICAIGWSGQWKVSVERSEKSVHLTIGLEDADFYLKPGESARSPRVLVMAWKGNFTDAHNRFRELMREYFSPKRRLGDSFKLPAALQTFNRYVWSMPYWSTEEGQIECLNHGVKYGVDTYWLDAAWFTGGFPLGVGNYSYKEGFPRGLRPISEEAHKYGLKFMVWFEPERVSEDTEVYREHPEWLLKGDNTVEWDGRKQALLNLGNPQAREWLTGLIIKLIEENDIDIYRQDFNMDPLSFWRAADEEGRRGLTEIKYIEGFYRFWDDLIERFPGLFIDNCSSGGRRIDLETCMRAVPMWRSDTGCFPLTEEWTTDMWNQNQTLGLSQYIPYFATGSWNPDAYEFRSAMAGGISTEFDVFSESFDFDMARKTLEEFDRIREFWTGDFYPLTKASLDQGHWIAYQLHRNDMDSGAVIVFRRAASPYESAVFPLKAVQPEKKYRLLLTDEQRRSRETTALGKEMLDGYKFVIPAPKSSLILEYYPL